MPVLSLDSNRWRQLTHAYGPAADTPVPLQKLYDSPNGDIWSDLFGTVLHQGDVTEAAYAAIPHVLAASNSVPLAERVEYLVFAAAAVDGLDKKQCPDDLKADFDAAIKSAREMAMEVLEHATLNDLEHPYLYETLAAVNGLPTLARIVQQFSNEEFTLACKGCGSGLYIGTSRTPFDVYAEDPVRNPTTASIPITPPVKPLAVSEVPDTGAKALPWLCWLSDQQENRELQEKFVSMYGDGECPKCSKEFNLYKELERIEKEAEERFRG